MRRYLVARRAGECQAAPTTLTVLSLQRVEDEQGLNGEGKEDDAESAA